jgi:hypothetical protein
MNTEAFSLRAQRISEILLWVWGLHLVAVVVASATLTAIHPLNGYLGTQGGGDQLNFAKYLAEGRNYFTRPSDYPMLTPQTPGLFPLLLAPLVRWFGPSLLYGNMLGLLSLLTTVAAISVAAYRASGASVSIPVSWILLLAMMRTSIIYSANRPDSLSAALAAISITLLVIHETAQKRPRRELLVAAGLFGLSAIFARQLAASVFVGAILFFVLRRAWRELCWFAIPAGLCGISSFLLLQALTDGGYWYNVWTLTRGMTSFQWLHWFRNAGLFSAGSFVSLGLVILGAATAAWHRLKLPPGMVLLLIIACVAYGLALATCWHIGGSLNYFAYANAALAAAGGSIAVFLLRRYPAALTVILLAAVLRTPLLSLTPWSTLRADWPPLWSVRRVQLPRTERLYTATAKLPGEVLFDRMPGLALLQGRRVEVETSALTLLKQRGLWSPRVFAADLARGRWTYVVALNLNMAGGEVTFANDPDLDKALRSAYRKVATYPLDSESSLMNAGAEIWAAGVGQSTSAAQPHRD